MSNKLHDWHHQQMGILNEEYQELKRAAIAVGKPHSISLKLFEASHGLKRGELSNWRANHVSRPTSETPLIFPSCSHRSA